MNQLLYRKPLPPVYVGIPKFTIVEIVLPGIAAGNNANQLNFVDQPYLRDKRIVGIEMYNDNDMSTSPTGKAILPNNNALDVYFTAYCDQNETIGVMGLWYQSIPFSVLHRIQNTSNDPFVRTLYAMDGNVFSWDKCYYTIGAPIGNTTDISFLMGVYFYDNELVAEGSTGS